VGNQLSPYYKSAIFETIMQRIAQKPLQLKIKEQNGKLSLVVPLVNTIAQAMQVLEKLRSEG
ncbi:MAG: hypothetical protein LBF55_00770, partial [Prevotellaceae bacterium]|nr:hypothetical protein [Prevotellaceae bacterium]